MWPDNKPDAYGRLGCGRAAKISDTVEMHAKALQGVRSAPFTAAEARAVIADQVNRLANAAAPDVSRDAQLPPLRFEQFVSGI